MPITPQLTLRAFPLAIASLIAACGASPPIAVDQGAAADSSGHRDVSSRLAGLARDQQISPDAASMSLPPPPGLDPSAVAPVAEENRSVAFTSRSDAITLLRRPELLPTRVTVEPPAPDARAKAIRLYIEGKGAARDGDLQRAAAALEACVKLDGASAEPFRELADVQFASGRTLTAVGTLRKAVERGLSDPRSLWILSRDAINNGRTDEAGSLLVAALESRIDKSDAALRYLVAGDLSLVLESKGLLAAAIEFATDSGSLPSPFGEPTDLREELGELYRRQSDSWRRIGDMHTRLGDLAAADIAYTRAMNFPTYEPDQLLARRVHALMRSGRSAESALVVLTSISDADTLPSETASELLRFIANGSSVRGAMVDAVSDVIGARRADAAPSILGSLARIRAGLQQDEEGVASLSAHLAASPDDSASARALLSNFHASPERAAVIAIGVVSQSPDAASALAEALTSLPGPATPWLSTLASDPSDAGAILHAASAVQLGRPAAATVVYGRAWSENARANGLLAECEVAASLADLQVWQRAIDALAAHQGAASQLARAYASRQLFDEASESLRPLLTNPSLDDRRIVADLLRGSQIELVRGNAPDADLLARRAVTADPFNEAAYEPLFSLHSANGAMPSSQTLTELARMLRQHAPSSRLLRVLSASELVARGLDDQAESTLRRLAEENPHDSGAAEVLIGTWERRARRSPGGSMDAPLAWLRHFSQTYPELDWPAWGEARLLAATNRLADAESILRARLVANQSLSISAALEALIRIIPGRRDEADAMTLARLDASPRTPDALIERVEYEARTGRPALAAQTLDDVRSQGVILTLVQRNAVMRSIATIVTQPNPPTDEAWARGIASLFDAAAAARVRFSPGLHEARLALLATLTPPDVVRITSALDDAKRESPESAPTLFARTALALRSRGAGPVALPFLRDAVRMSSPPTTEILFELLRLTVTSGEEADLDAMLDLVRDPTAITGLLATLQREDRPALPTEPEKLRAELAYFAGQFYASESRDDLADTAYRRAIAIDSSHAWSMNNLGYSLLERGGAMEEAIALLESAHALLPDETSITDSLGWARFHQGAFEDELSPDGAVRRPGAISLLKQAAATKLGANNPEILDHLGDALWMNNDKDGAVAAWERAVAAAQSQIDTLKKNPRTTPDMITAAEKERDKPKSKVDAVKLSQAPDVTVPYSQR